MTSYAFIKDRIKPHQSPSVFNSNAAAVLALKNKQINGLVVCSGGEGRRSVASALASTVVFFGIVVSAVTHAPGLPQVRTQFFNRHEFRSTFPEIARAFGLNIKIFCIAEVFILVFALFLAVLRSLPGAGVLPVARARDRVRRPLPRHHDDPCDRAARLRRAGARTERHLNSLVLIYSAYVSEVYRAGIDSIHSSQEAAARSLGIGARGRCAT